MPIVRQSQQWIPPILESLGSAEDLQNDLVTVNNDGAIGDSNPSWTPEALGNCFTLPCVNPVIIHLTFRNTPLQPVPHLAPRLTSARPGRGNPDKVSGSMSGKQKHSQKTPSLSAILWCINRVLFCLWGLKIINSQEFESLTTAEFENKPEDGNDDSILEIKTNLQDVKISKIDRA